MIHNLKQISTSFLNLKSTEEEYVLENIAQNNYSIKLDLINKLIQLSWMFEVFDVFNINKETLFISANVFEASHKSRINKKENIQLDLIISIMLATKMNETLYMDPDISRSICNDGYEENEIKQRETDLFFRLDKELTRPIIYNFIYLKNILLKSNEDVKIVSMIMGESCIFSNKLINIEGFLIADACIILANVMLNNSIYYYGNMFSQFNSIGIIKLFDLLMIILDNFKNILEYDRHYIHIKHIWSSKLRKTTNFLIGFNHNMDIKYFIDKIMFYYCDKITEICFAKNHFKGSFSKYSNIDAIYYEKDTMTVTERVNDMELFYELNKHIMFDKNLSYDDEDIAVIFYNSYNKRKLP